MGKAEDAFQALLAQLPEPDRALAVGLHALVQAHATALTPRTWYGMPAYALKGRVVLFFQPASRFKTRYATLGFTHEARLDEGEIWPVAFALKALTPEVERTVLRLLQRALEGLS
jgi:uncharacterized protein YdhG (YjbR/CyaY superfamily)